MDENKVKELFNEIYDIAYEDALKEAYKNAMSLKEKRIKRIKLAEELYNQVEYVEVEKLIRRDLPLRVKLFNKVSVIGKSLIGEGRLVYTYYFNDDLRRCFEYVPCLEELYSIVNK